MVRVSRVRLGLKVSAKCGMLCHIFIEGLPLIGDLALNDLRSGKKIDIWTNGSNLFAQ